jgi:hypothetical protein
MNEYVVGPDGYGTWKSTRVKDSFTLVEGVSEDSAIETTRVAIHLSGRSGEITLQGTDGQFILSIPVTV